MSGEAVVPAEARRWVLIGGLIGTAVLTALVGWLGHRTDEALNAEMQRDVFVQAACRTAVDLTTIDYQHAAADVQRVLDSTTGDFHQRYAESSQSLIDTVTRQHSQSVSVVTAAGLESQAGDAARVLVVLNVASTHLGGTDLPPHEMRMRVAVQRDGRNAKIAQVEYVQ
ncbi:MAG TPA: Mce protein [Mycobacterium sp.]